MSIIRWRRNSGLANFGFNGVVGGFFAAVVAQDTKKVFVRAGCRAQVAVAVNEQRANPRIFFDITYCLGNHLGLKILADMINAGSGKVFRGNFNSAGSARGRAKFSQPDLFGAAAVILHHAP